ncbi:MAG: UDP-N-acetylmuramoyl-L-alanine--D-glutamate ligase [Phycisphaeraceae bacterium]
MTRTALELDTMLDRRSVDLRDWRIVVMGLGRFGGGVGVTRFLVARGAQVLVTDKDKPEDLKDSIAQLEGLEIAYRLGGHLIEDFTGADLIVVNPAVKPAGNEYLAAARAAGVPETSEIRLLTRLLPNRLRTIGITGSAGKSTTTAMVGHILHRALVSSQVHVGGNLGGSLLNELDRIAPDDWVVLELSSFMLQGLREDKWSPHIALITNLAPNHLDWHGSFEAYREAKAVVLAFQDADQDVALLGPGVGDAFTPVARRVIQVHESAADAKAVPPLLIPGSHNRLNAAMAMEVCAVAGVDREVATEALADFAGLPHRLQFVCEHNGVRFFNDSKSTTPESARLALEVFTPDTVHIILGGHDKGSDLSKLAAFARQHCRGIYTLGATGPAIARASNAARGFASVVECETLDNALRESLSRARAGDVILLSPACASWGQFTHFEQRGSRFVEAVLMFTSEVAR